MRIVVVGCGKIGKAIIQRLVAEKHDVLAMDNNPAVIESITNAYDVMGLCANGTEYGQLMEAGAHKADLFIAVTGSDELNMLSCFAAKRMGAKHTVARIRNSENTTQESLSFMIKGLGLSMAINPEHLTAQAIYNIIKLPLASKVEIFSSKGFEMIELQLKNVSALEGKTVSEIRKQAKIKFLICAVSRNGETYIPKGDFTLRSGDKIGLIASEPDIPKLFKLLGVEQKPIKSVIILGGGMTSVSLASMLTKSRISTKIIEKEEARCEDICELVGSGVTVIHGDAMSQELLSEEGINTADAFVALTGMDEQNILISVYAMSQNVPKIISKVNRSELSAIAQKLGVDTVITSKTIMADIIARYARALQSASGSKVETLYSLMDGNAEAIEFTVMSDFKYIGVPLKDVKFKKNALLAGIVRNNKSIIPTGDDVILADDRVIVISSNLGTDDISDMLE
ncbi:MAG: Trk system potassium transporter TrkA [Clostridia bacterium]|nr:Trk system potassium transporter TrkA [Clostridia bacterium]